jgi:hypothetical protein
MTSVIKRTIRSSPYRDANETWSVIVELLTQGKNNEAGRLLRAITGVACSLITDQAANTAPLIATCDGPRTRIYCLYDDDSIDGIGAAEETLGFDPLQGDWRLSLPCPATELNWVQPALEKYGNRITARDLVTGIANDESSVTKSSPWTLNVESFLKS